jgi:hypothetical protein
MMENKKNVKLLIAAILGIIGVMRYKFLLAGMLFTSIFLAAGCDPADIEPMTINEDGSVTLTGDYEYVDPTNPPPDSRILYPVNPAGVSIKTAYTDSAGKKYVELTGTVPQWTITGGGVSANGIPEGLHQIKTTSATQPTDYPRPIIAAGDQVYDYMTYRGKDIPLENNIRLGSLYNNAEYTAVTISGLASGLGITLKETGNTIRLFTENYLNVGSQQDMTDFDRTAFQWRRRTFGNDPNYFSFASGPKRGSGTGGLNILVWNGASPKSTTLEFSYDGGRTWNKTVVDYSGVSFEYVPLEYMAWYKAPPQQYYPTPSGSDPVTLFDKVPKPTNPGGALGVIYNFSVTIERTAKSEVDNFLIPSFYPSNASNKQFYLMENGIKTTFVEDHNRRIEIADRIKITCKDSVTTGTTETFTIFCDTYPPGVNPLDPVSHKQQELVPIAIELKLEVVYL